MKSRAAFVLVLLSVLFFLFRLPSASAQASLTLGVPVTGSLSGTGDEKTYQVEVAAGEHLTVVPDATVNNLYDYDLYIRYGALPTTVVYDDVGDGTGADQSVQVAPPTQAGIYYLMIRSVSGDSSYVIGVRGFCHRVSLPMILRDR